VSETGQTIPTRFIYSECMPRYFFNFSRGRTPEPRRFKNEGLELPGHAAAWDEATTSSGEKPRGIDCSLRPRDGWKMEVTDADGKAIFVLRLTTEAASE
jgi:hypothetical protein